MIQCKEADIVRVDFHSHFLPGIDDGARDPAQSVAILKYLKSAGITDVCATPHYSMRHESVNTFLERREASCSRLMEYMAKEGVKESDIPKIHLGAEVALYRGLCDVKDVEKLSFGNGSFLIEIQFAPFGGWETEEVYNVMYQHNVRPVMAHINRYSKLIGPADFEEIFLNGDVIPQINCEVANNIFLFGKMKKVIKSSLPVVFGGDVHSPELIEKNGIEKMKKYLGSLSADFSVELRACENELLYK